MLGLVETPTPAYRAIDGVLTANNAFMQYFLNQI